MELKAQFEKVMQETVNMALATSAAGKANVRVVTFAYNPEKPGRVFFTTFGGSGKTGEFAQNPLVACMPLPERPDADVQVRFFGRVQKSAASLDEVVALIGKKYPGDADSFSQGGPAMEIYEVCFDEAFVSLGMSPAEKTAVV